MEISITFSIKPEIVREWYPTTLPSTPSSTSSSASSASFSTQTSSLVPPLQPSNISSEKELFSDKTLSPENVKFYVNTVKSCLANTMNREDSEYLSKIVDVFAEPYIPKDPASEFQSNHPDQRKKQQQAKEEKTLEETVENLLDGNNEDEIKCEDVSSILTRLKDLIQNCFSEAREFSQSNTIYFNKLVSSIYGDPSLNLFVSTSDPKDLKEVFSFLISSIKRYCSSERDYRKYERLFGSFFNQKLNDYEINEFPINSIPSLVNSFGALCSSSLSSSSEYHQKNTKKEAKKEKKDLDTPPFSE